MKKRNGLFSIVITLFVHAACVAEQSNRFVCTLITPQSLSVDAARELAGWQDMVNIYQPDGTYGVFAITPGASLSYRPERIAQCFFGDDIVECKCTFTVSGSRQDRTTSDWLADYFGLPTDYKSHVRVRPKVASAFFDCNLYVGFENHIPGLYARIHAPLVYSRWDMNMCETIVTTGSQAHDPGYFNPDGIPRIQLVDNFIDFITGSDAPKATNLTFHKLSRAKVRCKSVDLCKLSDIIGAIGYNIVQTNRYHLGFNLRFGIPTGNTPAGEFLFEPVIGNGHHWQLGGGVSTHIQLWHSDATQEKAGLYFDLNITHLFSARQCRSFDLCFKPNSRYMLAHKMGTPITQNLGGLVDGTVVTPTAQYENEVTPLANLTTIPVDVSIGVQADLALMIAYTKFRDSWTFGYGFWGRSCDCITLCDTSALDSGWAVKGDTHLFGFEDNASDTPIALSATQSQATINTGANFPQHGAQTEQEIADGRRNPGIDAKANAVADSQQTGTPQTVTDQPASSSRIYTSIQPILLSCQDINQESARTRGIAHKLFSSYTHRVLRKEISPYVGFGAEIQFGQSGECNHALRERSCINTALSLWTIWARCGASF